MNGQTFDHKEYKEDCRRTWDGINGKVSWYVFWGFLVVILGIFTYFANTDAGLSVKIDKNEERFYQYQQATNQLLGEIKTSVGKLQAGENQTTTKK